MQTLSDMIHQYEWYSPWFLLLVPLVLVAAVIGWTRRRPSLVVSSLGPFREGLKGQLRIMSLRRLPILLEVIGILLFIIALVRPQLGIEEPTRQTDGIDIILVLDVSPSMGWYDVPAGLSTRQARRAIRSEAVPNRIHIAKEGIRRFVERRPNDRIGLIAFSAEPYTVCPPTLDHDFLLEHLARLNAGMIGEMTGIAAPIAVGASRLKDSKAKRRVLVFFTDGDNNVEDKISPEEAARLAARFDVIIHTVGIGSKRVMRPVRGFLSYKLEWMDPRQATFNPDLMREIAAETDGEFFMADDTESFKKVMDDIDALETIEIEQPKFIDLSDLFSPFIYAGLICLGMACLAEHTVGLKVP